MFSLNKKPQKPSDNDSQHLLAAKTPLQVPIRTNMANSKPSLISLENPLADYKALMDTDNQTSAHETMPFETVAADTRTTIWKLLFEVQNAENEKKAAELLKEYKIDACFFMPFDYNTWIVTVRDELLKREMLDFWRNVIVKESLGPCWAKDSDYFSDLDDPEPAQFYQHAGEVAPWVSEKKKPQETVQIADNYVLNIPSAPERRSGFPSAEELEFSLENPVQEYRKIVEKYLTHGSGDGYEVEDVYNTIAESARKTVWSLLFDEPQPPNAERQKKAGDLLKAHRLDAVFYSPWVYNEWIVKLRDEVLKRGLLDFWRNQVVNGELGLCWARDSDFYDDMGDPEPKKFYEHAGCVAPWVPEEEENKANERNGQKK